MFEFKFTPSKVLKGARYTKKTVPLGKLTSSMRKIKLTT